MMKILLLIFTSVLLCSGSKLLQASDLKTNSLNDLPDERKLQIALSLSPEDQLNLSMVNRNFRAIMLDDKIFDCQSVKKFGLDYDQLDRFGKIFLANVIRGNFAICVDSLSKGYTNLVNRIRKSREIINHLLDDSGHVSVKSFRPDYERKCIENIGVVNPINRNYDSSIFVGECKTLKPTSAFVRELHEIEDGYDPTYQAYGSTEDFPSDVWQTRAVKYIPTTNEYIDLFPKDAKFESIGRGLNNDGSIILGRIYQPIEIFKKIIQSGFVYNNNDGSMILLKDSQQGKVHDVNAVSDQGEIVVGQVLKDKEVHAAIWLRDSDGDRYYPCLLYDLIMNYCSDAQRQLLQDKSCVSFSKMLAISPNGKTMSVQTVNTGKTRYSNIKIVFGSKIALESQEIDINN